MNKTELYVLAAYYKIPGRSKMTAPELEAALKSEGVDLVTVAENSPNAGTPAVTLESIEGCTTVEDGGEGGNLATPTPGFPAHAARALDALKPLSFADRVRHYVKQNGYGTLTADSGDALTPRQWRRAQKKQNNNRAYGTKTARYSA